MLPSEYACHDGDGEHHDQEGRGRVFQLEADRCHIYSGGISAIDPFTL
jgi:hypothetical protein